MAKVNALINKPRQERPPKEQRDLTKYPVTNGDLVEEGKLSNEELDLEFAKCVNSVEYFIDNYCVVIHPKDGLVPCIMYGYQRRDILRAFKDERFVITRKFRQGGFSTIAALFCLWELLFKTDHKILVVSKGDREAKEFMKLVKTAYNYLPDFLRLELLENNAHVMETELGTTLNCYTPAAGVSFSCKRIIIDEAAHIPIDMDDAWGKIFPVISTGGSCWVISTCNGVVGLGAWYYKMWSGAVSGENKFFPLDVSHLEHPEYQKPEWEAEMMANLGAYEYRQQVLREFIGGQDAAFKEDVLNEVQKTLEEPVKRLPCITPNTHSGCQNTFVWENPDKDTVYVVGIDIAEGCGENNPDGLKKDPYDYSTIQIFKLRDMEQVLEYKNDAIKPMEFAKVVSMFAKFYNNAVVVCESSHLGLSVISVMLNDLGYDNIYNGYAQRPGLNITKQTRYAITEGAVDLFSKGTIKIKSKRLFAELRTLIRKDKRIDHMSGYHDDLFSAAAYCYYVRDDIINNYYTGVEYDETCHPFGGVTTDELKQMSDTLSLYAGSSFDFLAPIQTGESESREYVNGQEVTYRDIIY